MLVHLKVLVITVCSRIDAYGLCLSVQCNRLGELESYGIVGSNGTARQKLLTAQKVFHLVQGKVDRIVTAYSMSPPVDRTKVSQRPAHQLPRLL